MKDYLKVEGHTHYYRDPNSKAIIIVDDNKRVNYLNQKRSIEHNQQNYQELSKEVSTLKHEVSEIKSSINQLIDLIKDNKLHIKE